MSFFVCSLEIFDMRYKEICVEFGKVNIFMYYLSLCNFIGKRNVIYVNGFCFI